MRRRPFQGIGSIQVLIIVLLVSVVATAVWNLQISTKNAQLDPLSAVEEENDIRAGLEDIAYHLGLAGYDLNVGDRPFMVENGDDTDVVKIWHNRICVEYFVDENNNLIRRINSTEKEMAKNIGSIKATQVGPNTMIVTISTFQREDPESEGMKMLSKSYSTVAKMKSLVQADTAILSSIRN